MGYVSRQSSLVSITAGATIIVANDAEKTVTNVAMTKVKEIKLVSMIYGESRFRFKFSFKSSDAGQWAYAKIYKNGIIVGSEFDNDTVVYEDTSEDIDIGNWQVGDTVELWVKSTGAFSVICNNFRICGLSGQFINTLGA
jgi:hypothetical protein